MAAECEVTGVEFRFVEAKYAEVSPYSTCVSEYLSVFQVIVAEVVVVPEAASAEITCSVTSPLPPTPANSMIFEPPFFCVQITGIRSVAAYLAGTAG